MHVLTALLEACSHDADMTVRLAVCEAITCIVRDQPHLQQAQQLLHVVSDCTLDKKVHTIIIIIKRVFLRMFGEYLNDIE